MSGAPKKEDKREKAKRLIALALNDGTTAAERNSAAMRAVKIIRKYKLLDVTPLDGILENEAVQAAKTVVDKLTDPELVGGLKAVGKMIGSFSRRGGRS